VAYQEGEGCDLNMSKILLINTNTEQAPYPVPPLGLCMLASALENKHKVEVYDGVFAGASGVVETVRRFNPDYIGFSIRNIDDIVAERNVFYIDTILHEFIEPVMDITKVPIILGGSGFSIFPGELMMLSKADYGITGEGVFALEELIDALEEGRSPVGLNNILTSDPDNSSAGKDRSMQSGSWKGFSNIDRWIDFAPYRRRGAYSIQTKRGCAHGCIYCTYPVIEGTKFVTREPSEIAEEIVEAHERLGDVTFEFVDSTFNDPENHAEDICREIIRRNLKVRLRTMGINPRHTSEKLFELMIRAGFQQIDATPDTASESMLKNMGKGFLPQDIEKMATLIRKFKLPTMWFFLFGGPGEDESTFLETIDFIDRYVSPDDLVYMTSGLRIYPGTPLQKIAIRENRISPEDTLLYPPSYYFSDKLEKERLNQLIRKAEKARPNCIPALETHPPQEMIAEAMEMRTVHNLTEPMFRTLLRIRKEWMAKGLL
jgi:radical SAM superfamily enzyme YgiQ (UPF0313 family)